jgi:LCP family protein required for cell wall assembly
MLPQTTPPAATPPPAPAPAAPPKPPESGPTKARVVRHRRPRYGRRIALGLAIFAVAVAAYFGGKVLLAANKIINRSNGGAPALAGKVDPTRLRGEGDGRINILLLGIGGPGHDGPNLSDTMIVASIDPRTKDVAMLSIPRDLYVKIPDHGAAKINAANVYGGPQLAEQVVSKILDLNIHYYVVVDFSAFRQGVESVGGVDVTVPTAITDPEYPCDNERGGYCPFKVAAGPQHMDGSVALRYARSRKTTTDFDRAARQQLILVALRQKALQASTLTSPAAISGLIDTVGNHVKTDMQLPEMQKLAEITKDVNTAKIVNKVLDTTPDGLLTQLANDPRCGCYTEQPAAGPFVYTAIQELAHSIFADGYLKQENAAIEIQNGTLRSGLATSVAKMLKGYNYNVVNATTADNQHYPTTVIYDYSSGTRPYTLNYLERRFGVKATRATPPVASASTPPAGQTTTQGATTTPPVTPDIRVILGADYRLPAG